MGEVQRVAKLAKVGSKVAARTAAALCVGDAEAETYARQTVSKLRLADFCRTEAQTYEDWEIDADIYGVKNRDGEWYVKLYVLHGQVWILSCHPPERILQREDGTKIGC